MIVPMEKITIACLEKDRQSAVSRLQELGTVHVVPMKEPASDALDALRSQKEQLSRVIGAFGMLLSDNKAKADTSKDPENPMDVVRQATALMEDGKRIAEEQAKADKAIAQLRPWGDFSQHDIDRLRERGIHIALCTAPAKAVAPALPEGAVIKTVNEVDGMSYFAVISRDCLDQADLPLAQLPPDTSLGHWTSLKAELSSRDADNHERLLEMAKRHGAALEEAAAELDGRIDFALARDGMAATGQLAFLRGYVPAARIDELRAAAQKNGWAIRYEEVPEDDEDAPIELKIARPFRMARHIFDFVGILPGYHETDVSVSMLVFLSLFCGILVGDAGYGTILTLVVLIFRRKVLSPQGRSVMNLLLTMSLCILVYGMLTCNWFAIPPDKLPQWMNICPWMCNNDKHIQLMSLFIGAFHMSMARLWRAVLAARKIRLSEDGTLAFVKKAREAIGHLAWGIFLWANFGMARQLIVIGGEVGDLAAPFVWMYAIGFVMILVFGIDWTDMGTVIYMPFSFINCFVDVLSYIRLFAVGLSGFYIANSFNGMAADLHSALNMPWLSIPCAIIILALGHLLNVALALMGVLVHGVRLNTLEFSGHMDLSWSGKAYRPLKTVEKTRDI